MSFSQIQKEIKSRKFAPVYYFYGEENYFIDQLVSLLDKSVLSESEAAFNKTVLYGEDADANKVLTACRSFPVMANHRLTIVKEAQRISKSDWEKIETYIAKPVSSTVLVLAVKGGKGGLGKKEISTAQKSGVVFHAKRMYERDVQQWAEGYLKDAEFEVDPGIAGILVSNLGTNINLIENELQKMFIYLKATQQTRLTQAFVYEMINVDKEFNVFELVKALSERQAFRCHMIIDRLTQNTKINPPILTLNALFRFFHNTALVHSYKLHDPNAVKNQLKVNYYAAQDYLKAKKHYHPTIVYRNLEFIKDADLTLKGQISSQMDDRHLLKTLVWKLLN